MTHQFSHLANAPVSLPVWQLMLDDLGDPPAHRVAKALGIGERTVYRYRRDNHAPKACMLALFWLTRWGRSVVHTQAVNDAAVAMGYVDALRRQVAQLEHEKAKLLSLGGFGAANAPLLGGRHV